MYQIFHIQLLYHLSKVKILIVFTLRLETGQTVKCIAQVSTIRARITIWIQVQVKNPCALIPTYHATVPLIQIVEYLSPRF